MELPLVIRRGNVATEPVAVALEYGAARVAAVEGRSPRSAAIRVEVVRSLPVEKLPVTPFVAYGGHLNLARFSRYWLVAGRHAFGQPPLFDEAAFDR